MTHALGLERGLAAVRSDHATSSEALSRAVAAERFQDAARSSTLPPEAYLNGRFFELERDILFIPGWIAIAHVSQLADPHACTVSLFGEEVCAGLKDGSTAAWARAADGSSRPVRTEVLNGFVYVNLSGDAAPLESQIRPLSSALQRLRLDELTPVFRMDYDSAFNWKILVETFMECYHHAGAHPKTFQVNFPTRLAGVGDHGPLWTSGYSTARDDVGEESLLTGLPLLAEDTTDYERRSFFLYHIYPNQLIATLTDRVAWFRSQPVSPGVTKLQVFMLVRPEARQDPAFDEIIAREHAFFTQVNDEDIAANESQQLGLGAVVAEPGRFSPLELSLWHFASYVRERVAAARAD
jgi:phenylpropionate dioxygenase-like ring-hydroxylating dioxygenase large terminal subunit